MKPEAFEVKVHGKYGVTPVCMEDGSVGYDIALPQDFGNLVMPFNSRRAVDTGIVIKPPMKCFTLIVPRSSSRKKGIRISNTVGVIDPSYCGQDDHLIVDLTRDPKKKTYIGQLEYSDITPMENLPHREAASIQFKKANPSYADEDGRLHQYYCMEDETYHFFWEPEDTHLIYRAGERFCQVLFLPYYKPELLEAKLDEFGIENRGGFGSTGQ